jgi:hypothetical protein
LESKIKSLSKNKKGLLGQKIRMIVKKITKILKAAQMPLIVLVLSLITFVLIRLYLTSTLPNITPILESICEGLISGAVFYFFTVTIPSVRQKKIAKNYAIQRYIKVKKDMLSALLLFLHKPNHDLVEKSARNYQSIREHVTRDDLYTIANDLTKDLVKESLYHLAQLKEILITLLAYDFVKDNSLLYQRIQSLNYWINQFHHNYDAYYTENDERNFSKTFVGFINEFLRGTSLVTGPRPHDDFIDLLENA